MSKKVDESHGHAGESPSLRQVAPEELTEILEAHRKWVESEGREGKRGDLSWASLPGAILNQAELAGASFHKANLERASFMHAKLQQARFIAANLQNARLDYANLQTTSLDFAQIQGAYLEYANLQDAHLHKADLRGAHLRQSNLKFADLRETNLRDVDLQDADLTDAKGLLAGQLAGANVSGAKLPDDIQKFQGLEIVAETSQNSGRVFIATLLGCIYTWLTVATTTDVRLLTNSASSPLPVIGTEIPIVGFYWVAPLVLLCLYCYLHLYLQDLWRALASLPAIFPDGRALDERAYPWLLNGLVRSHFVLLRRSRPPLFWLKFGLSILLAWWVVPMTLLGVWARYLSRHDWGGSLFHIGLVGISIGAGAGFYKIAARTLRGEPWEPSPWKRFWGQARSPRTWVETGGGVILYLLLLLLSYGAINGVPPRIYEYADLPPRPPDVEATDIRRVVPLVFRAVALDPFADLFEADVSTKPAGWTGQKDEGVALVRGARLSLQNLQYAFAMRAFLVNADLRWADLRGAILIEADLRGADLFAAKIQRANLHKANLRGANLTVAELQGASLENAHLRGATLRGANLRGASLRWADLRGADLGDIVAVPAGHRAVHFRRADLQDARLDGADLRGAKLQWASGLSPFEVKGAKNWELAFYPKDFLKELGLTPDHNQRLEKKLAELEKTQKTVGQGQ